MASIRKRGDTYQVRYRDACGTERSVTCPDRKTAKAIKLDIEKARVLGEVWRPVEQKAPPTLAEVFDAYLEDLRRRVKPSTVEQYRIALRLFRQHLKKGRRGRLRPAMLTEQALAGFFDALQATNNRSSAADSVRHVQRAWTWAFRKNRRFENTIPLPELMDLPHRQIELKPWAPSWALADRLIEHCWSVRSPWYGDLLAVMRYTGLRKSQVMGLVVSDFDLGKRRLYIRPALGKTRQERQGRVVPVCAPLVELIQGWGRTGFLIETDSDKRRIDNVTLRKRWEAVGITGDDLRQPTHALRKMFVTQLRKAGGDPSAVKALVGHSMDLTSAVYTTSEVLMPLMQRAVDLIPAIGASERIEAQKDGSACGHTVDSVKWALAQALESAGLLPEPVLLS